jgi:hypothetical protein
MKHTSFVSASGPQLELAFAPGSLATSTEGHRTGRQLATWWFRRMREVVDRAVDWKPAQRPRPEQIWLPNTRASARGNS